MIGYVLLMWAWEIREVKMQLRYWARRMHACGHRHERDCSCTELGGREWVAPQMSFLAKPMRITGIWMQLDVHRYVINVTYETSIVEDIVDTLIEEATHSFTRLLL